MNRHLLRKVYQKAGLGGLPAAALAVMALTELSWLGYLLCAATLLVIWWTYRLDGLGEQRTGRVLVVSAALLDLVRGGAGSNLPLVVTGVLLVGLIANETNLSNALMTGRLRTANLDVRRGRAEWAQNRRVAYLLTTGLTVLLLTFAALSWTHWLLAGLAFAVTVGFAAAVLTAWYRRRRSAYQKDVEVHDAVAAAAPTFMIYFSAPPASEYQLLMWLPYLERIGEPYIIVLREAQPLQAIAGATKRPVIVVPTIANLENVIVPSIGTVFYVNNGMRNVHCLRFRDLTHVQLMHGDSDKRASYNPIIRVYDRIYVPGQAGVDRYLGNDVQISASQFRIVGRPQVAQIEVRSRPIDQQKNPVVLYAPTWTGSSSEVNYSSLAVGERILRGLLARNLTVIFRAHPYTDRNPAAAEQRARLEQLLAEDAHRTGRAHRWGRASSGDLSLVECFNLADALVADVSAVASDWLYSEKPFAMTDVQDEGERFSETFPLSRAAYVVNHRASNMDQVVHEMLGPDPLAPVRREVKTYYLGDFPADGYVDAFVSEARRCVAGRDELSPVSVEDHRR